MCPSPALGLPPAVLHGMLYVVFGIILYIVYNVTLSAVNSTLRTWFQITNSNSIRRAYTSSSVKTILTGLITGYYLYLANFGAIKAEIMNGNLDIPVQARGVSVWKFLGIVLVVPSVSTFTQRVIWMMNNRLGRAWGEHRNPVSMAKEVRDKSEKIEAEALAGNGE